MPSKKTTNQNESVTRLRDLLNQLKSAQGSAVDLTEQARREVGDAMAHAGLMPHGKPGAPQTRARRKQKKR
jgi:hypothetical protein